MNSSNVCGFVMSGQHNKHVHIEVFHNTPPKRTTTCNHDVDNVAGGAKEFCDVHRCLRFEDNHSFKKGKKEQIEESNRIMYKDSEENIELLIHVETN